MKVYFVGSISGRKKYLDNYKAIVSLLKKQKIEIVEDTIHPTREEVYAISDNKKVEFYKQVLKWINLVDIIIAEGSYSSLGVGYEISLALEKGKPVIVLYEEGHAPHFLEGINSDKLIILKYTLADLDKTLKNALSYASEQMDTRFNFFISPKISTYLDWIAKKKRVPRAVFLRNLIEDDMKKQKDYKK